LLPGNPTQLLSGVTEDFAKVIPHREVARGLLQQLRGSTAFVVQPDQRFRQCLPGAAKEIRGTEQIVRPVARRSAGEFPAGRAESAGEVRKQGQVNQRGVCVARRATAMIAHLLRDDAERAVEHAQAAAFQCGVKTHDADIGLQALQCVDVF
jgi:hypothetical protein